jgi:hypothetical protein
LLFVFASLIATTFLFSALMTIFLLSVPATVLLGANALLLRHWHVKQSFARVRS